MKIKNQLLLTHGILVALALAIVFINIYTYKDMENDANIINQAGKLRMLSYNMAHLSNQITTGSDPVHEEKRCCCWMGILVITKGTLEGIS